MNRRTRALALFFYVSLTLVGPGLHLLEFAREHGCAACETPPRGPAAYARCGDGPLPCHDRNHTHHDHPIHQHENGCVTCSAFSTQHVESEAPSVVHVETSAAPPSLAASLPTPPAVHRPPNRAPPAL